MIIAIDTNFVADKASLDQAYARYVEVANRAASLPGVDVLFIAETPEAIHELELAEDLIHQFKIERPTEDSTKLEPFRFFTIVSGTEESLFGGDTPVTSQFFMDDEFAPADDFPSTVGYRVLKELTTSQ